MREIAIEKTREDGLLPEKKHPGDHGWDLSACHFPDMVVKAQKRVVLEPGQMVRAGTGFRIALPEDMEFQIRSRSGRSMEGLVVANSPATIDAGYRGEVFVILRNISRDVVVVDSGDRVAQGVFADVAVGVTIVEQEVPVDTQRGEDGLGSTGS